MTAGTGDARFDQDGTDADHPAAEPAAPARATPDAAAGTAAAAQPASAAPAWLTGEAALPWPPPEGARPRADSAVTIPPPRRPGVRARPPVRPLIVPGAPPRPRIVEEPGILGLSRLTRGRFGSRLFTLFFVLVFTLIAVEMVVSILYPW
jgi:hypothetical protein